MKSRKKVESNLELMNEFFCVIEENKSEAALDELEKRLVREGHSNKAVVTARYQAWASYSKHAFR